MSLFNVIDGESIQYKVTICNFKQFTLCVKYISCSCTLRQVVNIFNHTKDVCNIGYIGNINQKKVMDYTRLLVTINLQIIKECLKTKWRYSLSMDCSTNGFSSYLDLHIRFYDNGEIKTSIY